MICRAKVDTIGPGPGDCLKGKAVKVGDATNNPMSVDLVRMLKLSNGIKWLMVFVAGIMLSQSYVDRLRKCRAAENEFLGFCSTS